MLAIVSERKNFSVEEYTAFEEESDIRHEYHHGEITAMAGGTPNHSLICNSIGGIFKSQLKGQNCFAFNSDLQIATSEQRYVYADASVICGELEMSEVNKNAVKNPTIIVEVLSESTADYDRGKKLLFYLQIPSFQEYILIDQDRFFVQVYSKINDGQWTMNIYDKINQVIHLQSIAIVIEMNDLYEGVVL